MKGLDNLNELRAAHGRSPICEPKPRWRFSPRTGGADRRGHPVSWFAIRGQGEETVTDESQSRLTHLYHLSPPTFRKVMEAKSAPPEEVTLTVSEVRELATKAGWARGGSEAILRQTACDVCGLGMTTPHVGSQCKLNPPAWIDRICRGTYRRVVPDPPKVDSSSAKVDKCGHCHRPLATQEDYDATGEDGGDHLCWNEFHGRMTDCEREPEYADSTYDRDLVPHTPGHRAQGVTPEARHGQDEEGGDPSRDPDSGGASELPAANSNGLRQRHRGCCGDSAVETAGAGDAVSVRAELLKLLGSTTMTMARFDALVQYVEGAKS